MASSERALGRYTLEEPIATGTTATVWRARDTRTGDLVAVKRFHAHVFADRVARKRMENEARAALRVHAPTVVSAIGRVATRDEFALIFPFVAGVPLSERLRTTPRLSADEAARIATDVADALAAIHSAGLVHRDVKPGNVLLGEDGQARLLDFGISRAITEEIALDQALTGAGLAIGTLPYMAPEQLLGEPASPATDVFGLGVVLYEMLSGKRPFGATTPVALAVEQGTLPARIAEAPVTLMDATARAMSPDPGSRPTSAQLASLLRTWRVAQSAADAPFAADAPTAPVTTVAPIGARARAERRFERLTTVAVAICGLLVVAVVALAAISPAATQPVASATPAAIALAPTDSSTPIPIPTSAPVLPSVQPNNAPQPISAATVQPPGSAPPAKPPKPAVPKPRSESTGHGHRHHRHHHHHRRHHHH